MRAVLLVLMAGLCGYLLGAKQTLKESLLQADRNFDQAAAARGAEGWGSFFAEDGMMVTGPGAPIQGRTAVREAMMPLFSKPENSLRWTPEIAVASKSGDLGYTIGTSRFRGLNPEGKRVERDGRYVTIWRKDPQGGWKVVVDIGANGPSRPVH